MQFILLGLKRTNVSKKINTIDAELYLIDIREATPKDRLEEIDSYFQNIMKMTGKIENNIGAENKFSCEINIQTLRELTSKPRMSKSIYKKYFAPVRDRVFKRFFSEYILNTGKEDSTTEFKLKPFKIEQKMQPDIKANLIRSLKEFMKC
jgi:hypothetical protein